MKDKNKIALNTFLAQNALLDNLKEYFILHIPHAKRDIPILDGFNQDLISGELDLLTDSDTDRIFNIDGVAKVVFPYSRIFCDVERLDDDHEPMFRFGRGFYYTKTDKGDELRILNQELKSRIKSEYYDDHHNKLHSLIDQKLKQLGYVYIVDCHSFNNMPLHSDLDKSEDRPDICIGTDSFHTPDWLTNLFVHFFTQSGFSVKVNSPYSGTIIPSKFYGNDKVMGIMVEINKKLYMDGNHALEDKISFLNKLIGELLVP